MTLSKKELDEIRERAEKALQLSQEYKLEKAYKYRPCGHGDDEWAVSWDGRNRFIERTTEGFATAIVTALEDAIHSRTDTPKLLSHIESLEKDIEELRTIRFRWTNSPRSNGEIKMKLSHFLMSHARGYGKTHNLAILIKDLPYGTLIVRDEREAKRIRDTYGIGSFSYDSGEVLFIGRRLGITYVDPDAVGLWVSRLEEELSQVKQERDDYEAVLIKIMKGRVNEVHHGFCKSVLSKYKKEIENK